MAALSKKIDKYLLDLAWSLWTELGVAGVKRSHQQFLITLEELILLTAVLADVDPRLRDESLDWSSQYYGLLSISRLKALLKYFKGSMHERFSIYSATLNSLSKADWPLYVDTAPLRIVLSGKSCLRPIDSPALLNIRARSLFGPGARADLVTLFLTHSKNDFSAADASEIGYSKRNIAEILEEFSLSGLFEKFMLRNQQRYRLVKNDHLIKALAPIPRYFPLWKLIFEVVFALRECVIRTEKSSENVQVIEIRNCLIEHSMTLKRLNLTPPSFQNDFQAYLISFDKWINELLSKLAQGDFPDDLFLSLSKR